MTLRPILLLALSTSATAAALQDRFPAREHVQPGLAEHIAIAAGDLDGDGRDDVVSTSGLATLHVYLGKATYGVAPSFVLDVEEPAMAVDLGDFDADGDLDVAFTTSKKVFVVQGDGLGGLSTPTQVGFINGGDDLCAGDVDADGRADLVALSKANGLVKTFLAAPQGGFQAPTSSALGQLPEGIELGDLNGDGLLDVVMASTGGLQVISALGNGAGGFTKYKAMLVTNGPPVSIALGDLDRDGWLDIVAGSTNSGLAYAFEGSGTGGFSGPTFVYDAGPRVALLDWDGDGYADLASAREGKGNRVVLNDGSGNLQRSVRVPGSWSSYAVASCDGDGDGHADIAFGAITDVPLQPTFVEEVTLVGLVNGTGSKQVESVLPIANDLGGEDPVVPLALDLDQDGDLDIVGRIWGDSGAVVIRRGDGQGGLLASEVHSLPNTSWLVAGDVSGDGLTDLVASTNDGLYVLASAGPAFAAPQRIDVQVLPSARIALADMDQDGDEDLAVWSLFDLVVLLNQGDGTFSSPIVSPLPSGVHLMDANLGLFRFVDLDGDRTLDFIANDQQFSYVHTFKGLPSGRLVHWGTTGLSFSMSDLVVYDLHEDGIDDLLVAPFNGSGPALATGLIPYLSDGSGTFQAQGAVEIGPNPGRLFLHDVNGDGHLDVFAAMGHWHNAWIPGDGDGGFGPPMRFAATGSLLGLGDLDGDGRCDALDHPLAPTGFPPGTLAYQSVLQR